MKLSSVVVGLSLLLAACTKADAPLHAELDAGNSHDDDRDARVPDAATHHDAGSQRVFDAGSDPRRNKVEPGHLCARVAAIECAGEAACCKAPGRSAARCLPQREQACVDTLALDALSEAPEVGFEAAPARAALTELEHRASTCDPQVAVWLASSEGLAAAFAGTLGKGDACAPEQGLDADEGAVAVALASCQASANLTCLPGATSWTCAPRLSPQASCFRDANCADGLYCAGASDAVDGACRERLPAGDACVRAGECASLVCRAGACAADDDEQAAYCP